MRHAKIFLVLTIVFLILLSCATVPVTGRRQLALMPSSTLNSLSFQQYSEFMSGHRLSGNAAATQMVKNVGNGIKDAVRIYMTQQGSADALQGYEWEFNLIDDSLVNAWCMPGGKVVVYTGLLSVAKDETDLAVVMGHEIAHAIANHGNERMTQGIIANMGSIALSEALKNKPEETKAIFQTAYGVGVQLGALLPYSRLHESEADHMGLIFMAMAGYDPNKAVGFWERMTAMKAGGGPPEFLSTHPSDATRISQIKALIPEAMQYYKKK